MQTSSRYPYGKGTNTWTVITSTNDSDYTWTVPTGKTIHLLGIYAQLTASGVAGNRVLAVAMGNGAAGIWTSVTGGSITAGQVGQLYLNDTVYHGATTDVHRNFVTPANLVNVQSNQALPSGTYLNAGYTVRIWDAGVVDAAADDMVIVLHYIEYDA